jgi:recombination protein RecA
MSPQLCPKAVSWEEQIATLGVAPASRICERPPVPTVPFGVAEVDALTGGLPRGALTEICGAASSGRTSLLLAVMAEATRRQELCALVDVSDSFDPHSAASAGVDLERLLWIRCRGPQANAAWQRNDSCMRRAGSNPNSENRKSQFARMEQALKAADLLLQAGGFGLVVMDLADVPSSMARRIPLTSWFRFRRAVENTPAALLVLEEEPHAKSCASLVLQLRGLRLRAQQERRLREVSPARIPSHARVLEGLEVEAEVLRDMGNRKPPGKASAEFASQTEWRIGGLSH